MAAGLVVIGAQRRAAQVRRLEALTSDLEDDFRAYARGSAVVDRDEIEGQGRRLRYQALGLGASRIVQRINHALQSLDAPFEDKRG